MKEGVKEEEEEEEKRRRNEKKEEEEEERRGQSRRGREVCSLMLNIHSLFIWNSNSAGSPKFYLAPLTLKYLG